MTKRLTTEKKGYNAVRRVMRLLNLRCENSCKVCPFNQHKAHNNEFYTITGFTCPKNQIRKCVEQITGMSRFHP